MKRNENPAEAAGAGSPEAAIAEKIAWLETCGTALDEHGLAVLDQIVDAFVRVYYGRVQRRLLSRGVHESHVEDVAQEVFTTLFRRVRATGAKDGLRKLLAKITKGKLLNYRRDHASAPETAPLPSSGSLPGTAVDAESALYIRELAARYFEELSPNLQAVVQKAILEDLTDAETAAALGLPEGTVKSRLRAAIRVLRALAAAGPPSSGRDAA